MSNFKNLSQDLAFMDHCWVFGNYLQQKLQSITRKPLQNKLAGKKNRDYSDFNGTYYFFSSVTFEDQKYFLKNYGIFRGIGAGKIISIKGSGDGSLLGSKLIIQKIQFLVNHEIKMILFGVLDTEELEIDVTLLEKKIWVWEWQEYCFTDVDVPIL